MKVVDKIKLGSDKIYSPIIMRKFLVCSGFSDYIYLLNSNTLKTISSIKLELKGTSFISKIDEEHFAFGSITEVNIYKVDHEK
jgi:hypothetical protein